MSPDRSLDFTPLQVTPESRRGSPGVIGSASPVPAGSLIDVLEEDQRMDDVEEEKRRRGLQQR
eukprot:9837108-Alexandrium_andersonii.AAC.1